MHFRAKYYRKAAWNTLKNRWNSAMILTIVAFITGVYSFGPRPELLVDLTNPAWLTEPGYYNSFSELFAINRITLRSGLIFLFGGATRLGHNLFYANMQRKEKYSLSTLFCRLPIITKAMGLRVLIRVLVLIGSVFLIVPGVMLHYRYAMATWILADKPELSVLEAMKQSAQMMRGNQWRMLMLDLSFIGWILLGLVTCLIGFIFTVPYLSAAHASFYLSMQLKPN